MEAKPRLKSISELTYSLSPKVSLERDRMAVSALIDSNQASIIVWESTKSLRAFYRRSRLTYSCFLPSFDYFLSRVKMFFSMLIGDLASYER